MRRPSRRVLPTVIGTSVAATLAADIGIALARTQSQAPGQAPAAGQFVAASQRENLSPTAVAPLTQRLSADLLVASARTLPPAVVERVRRLKGVRGAEVIDAAQALVAGKRVGLVGVDPSTFRAYTPKPTAESDALWRNIYAGDVAVSFVFGADGGVKLGSTAAVGGRQRQRPLRIGAYATMGMSQIDAVVSHSTAQSFGMPTGNALVVSAPKADAGKLRKALAKMLPKGAKAAEIHPEIRLPSRAPAPGRGGRIGEVLSAQQISIAIQAAQSKLGVPYVWGGESDAEGGYDCSGLLQYAFGQAGIRMPRVAADQARTGWRIPFAQARPGDLLIWANDPTAPGYISHIALYIGGGKMVVAPHTGDVVKIQQVYFTNFQGAIRINPKVAARLA
ncbi:MAG TPA: C40 family peptidase [Streptosporangiaceae bacterium]|nr:C40 family peptidase [Streptosporangiaceae bacterium]